MLSYQHIYHAGCLADIHKHAALCAVLDALIQKDKPLSYIETHAGRGLYDLMSSEAQKTGEAAAGILRARAKNWFTHDHPYSKALKNYPHHLYPGSPLLARHILRAQDRLHLCELHPQEMAHLRTNFKTQDAALYHQDGFEALKALCPPTPRRGLVMIDPSYEIKSEYQKVPQIIAQTIKKWPVAVIFLWYPVLSAALHEDMKRALSALTLTKSHTFEIDFKSQKGIRGSGLFLVNMPFGAEAAITHIQNTLKDNI